MVLESVDDCDGTNLMGEVMMKKVNMSRRHVKMVVNCFLLGLDRGKSSVASLKGKGHCDQAVDRCCRDSSTPVAPNYLFYHHHDNLIIRRLHQRHSTRRSSLNDVNLESFIFVKF